VADSVPQFLSVGAGEASRKIAFRRRDGTAPDVVWLGGFRSDMLATKAGALDDWAREAGHGYLRLDYSGHGESGGRFEDGTIGRWLEDALAVIAAHARPRPVLVGSSMGGWIALLAARILRQKGTPASGLVLIAPAPDFTQTLMWDVFPAEVREEIQSTGRWLRHSDYSPDPYPITRALIEEGRNHLLLGGPPLVLGCPVHILQGMQDPDVPWRHALKLVEHLPGDEVVTTLIRDGDHRLSRPQDIARLVSAVEAMVEEARAG
jgi:pimeloyl-ACP methyl ester carboxylesterase